MGVVYQSRVWVDITRPLMQMTYLNRGGNHLWVPFKYERLRNFHVKCGVIIHKLSNCKYSGVGNKMHANDLN